MVEVPKQSNSVSEGCIMTEQPEDVKMYIVAEIKEFCVLYIEVFRQHLTISHFLWIAETWLHSQL